MLRQQKYLEIYIFFTKESYRDFEENLPQKRDNFPM